MNVRNANEKPEKKEMKGEVSDEKGAENREKPAKKFGRYFVAATAIVATLGLSACGLDGTGRRTLDFDSAGDAPADNMLEGFEDGEDVEGEVADVPEELDVPDVEMDVADEDVASDVEDEDMASEDVESEDVSGEDTVDEDTSMDTVSEDVMEEDVESEDTVSEDAVSEDVTGEDVESEDVPEEDTSMDTSADTVDDEVSDAAGEDVLGDDAGGICSPEDEVFYGYIYEGSTELVGNVGVKYKGTDTSGNAIFDITCDGTVVRSDVSAPMFVDVTVDVPEHAFEIVIRAMSVSGTSVYVSAEVDAY